MCLIAAVGLFIEVAGCCFRVVSMTLLVICVFDLFPFV